MMINLFILLCGRTLQLSYCNFFNACTLHSEFHQQGSFTVAEDATHHFAHSNLHPQSALVLLPTVTI